ncbi:nuclear envelope integral membrane protein 2 [Triplophysa dalaica]|uniref:nuclear envelope integral membrane protein 2 n=1 Tax=Triplophysa dalaica TaxID=1582913 RepID=UPI0024DF92A1|nr:nuclear envelope integral membrane protein 2 [Triplophysa dalaica]
MRNVNVFIHILIIVWAGWRSVEGNRDYSYADCTYVKGDSAHSYSGSRCFCYSPGTVIKWKDCWSTFKVNVTSDENVFILFPMKTRNCQHPDDFLSVTNCFVEHYWPSTIQREKALDIPLVNEDVCFMTKSPRSNTEYTLHVSHKRLNKMRFLLFIFGLVLFLGAVSLCRSSLLFYTTGVSLGIIAIFVFLMLIFRNFVPKQGLFLVWLGSGSSFSYMGIQQVLNDWDDIVTEHWMELLGYVLISGLVSFAVCYKLGPITNKHTLGFMTLCMQAVGIVLLYHGISYPTAFYILLTLLLFRKILHFVRSILVGMFRLFCFLPCLFGRKNRPRNRLLTEEEYREQGERHTKACLDELREHCNRPGFPAWDTVLRVRSPQMLAEFLRSGCHVTPEELQSYESHYGLGGEYHEGMLFNSSSSDGQIAEEESSHEELQQNYTPTPNNLPGPSECTPSVCPYPPVNYSPQPEPMDAEDQDFF